MSLVNDALKKARMEAARVDAADRNSHYPLLGRGERETSGAWIFGLGALVLLAGIGGLFLFRSGKQSALNEQLATATEASRSPELEAGTAPLESPARAVTGSERTPAASDSTVQAAESPTAQRSVPTSTQPEPTAATGAGASPGAPSGPGTPGIETATSLEPGSQSATEERVAAAQTPSSAPSPAEDQTPPPDPAPQEFLQRADIPGVGPVELGGIAWSGDRPFALVNGRVVRPGDSISGLIVEDIQPNTVRLRGDSGTLVFRLK